MFNKNQQVTIKDTKIISGKNGGTPGVFRYFRVQPNIKYKIILVGFRKGNCKSFLWIASNNNKTILKRNLRPLNKNFIEYDNSHSGIIKIGVLFRNPRTNYYFHLTEILIEKISSENSQNISPKTSPNIAAKTPPKIIKNNTPKTLQNAPKTLQNAPKTLQNAPKTLQNAPKTLQNAPKTLQNAPKISPNIIKNDTPKTSPNVIKNDIPKISPNVIKNDIPKTSPNVIKNNPPKTSPNVIKNNSKNLPTQKINLSDKTLDRRVRSIRNGPRIVTVDDLIELKRRELRNIMKYKNQRFLEESRNDKERKVIERNKQSNRNQEINMNFNVNRNIPNSRISIVIPCHYVHFKFLKRLFDIYKYQTLLPDEIIVVLSNANNLNKSDIESLKNRKYLFQVKIIQINHKSPAGENRYQGSKIAQGDIIIFQDADDIPHPQRNEIIKYFYDKYPSTVHILHKYSKTKEIFRRKDIHSITALYLNRNVFADRSHRGYKIANGCCSIHKSIVNKISWERNKWRGQDVALNKEIFNKFRKSLFIKDVLYYYREEFTVRWAIKNQIKK